MNDSWTCAAAYGAVIAITIALYGCGGGPPRAAQTALNVLGDAVTAVDHTTAPLYEQASNQAIASLSAPEALRGPDLLAAYHRRMRAWDVLLDALRTAQQAYLFGVHALDAWRGGVSSAPLAWQRAATCAVASLANLANGLQVVGVDAPPALSQAVLVLGPFAGSLCDQASGVPPEGTSERHEPGGKK